jgi:TatD DNase family protein
MALIDTHAHLTYEGLIENIDEVVSRALLNGISDIITIATEPADFEGTLELAKRFDNIYAGAGIHPHHAKEVTNDSLLHLRAFAENEYVVAIGETGLDFHYNFSEPDAQRELFARHLEIAVKTEKPVVIHSRNAFDETLEILEGFKNKLSKIVFHCYSGTKQQTEVLLDRGYHISFTGIVTFKNAELAREAAMAVPLGRMMLETDCPYMSPAPMRNQKINEPALMVHTAEFVAKLKGIDFNEFCEQVTDTSRGFFGI